MTSTKLTAFVTTVMMLAGGAAVATAQPARAAVLGHVYAASVNGHTRATFKSYGNWFYAFDTKADGSSGLGQIYYAKKYRTISVRLRQHHRSSVQ